MSLTCGDQCSHTRIQGKLTMSQHISETGLVHSLHFEEEVVCCSTVQGVWHHLHLLALLMPGYQQLQDQPKQFLILLRLPLSGNTSLLAA
uniref:Equilibrative nucleotide transporter 3-like n=1 Tax=Rhizophora mucronata TaxID=61149 RepID=A0A2P2KM79_RHIMU